MKKFNPMFMIQEPKPFMGKIAPQIHYCHLRLIWDECGVVFDYRF